VEPEYAQSYRELYERHWWWRARELMVLRVLEDIAPADGFGRILDVGCGDGLFFPSLAALGEPEGVEPDASIVTDIGRSRGLIFQQPFDEAFLPSHTYGLVLLLDVIEHLADPVEAMAQARRLLAPAGHVVVTVPAFPILWTSHDDFNQHLRRYCRHSLEEEARAAGLEVEFIRFFFHWMFPIKLALAASERLRLLRARRARVPVAFANDLLYAASRLEQRLTSKISLPFGNSLIAVLR
jgi:SAM-dependent methyltransferase